MQTALLAGARRPVRRAPLMLALAALVALPVAGCDSGGGVSDQTTITGRVTTDVSSFAGGGPVEGATVTAAAVEADGSTAELDGEATTAADGSFSLTTEGTSDVVLLTATGDGGFRSRVLLEAGAAAGRNVQAPPMTVETDAEAAVYLALAARNEDATTSDVQFYVTAAVASDVAAGTTTPAAVAAAIDAMLTAEGAYASSADVTASQMSGARSRRTTAAATYRSALVVATTAEARAAALRAFEEAYTSAYAGAGVSSDVQAQAATSALRAAVRFQTGLSAESALALERQARLYAAQSAALAVEAAFEAEGAGSTRLSALAAARAALATSVRAAASTGAFLGAEATYRAAVETELAAETGLTSVQLQTGAAAANAARATLNTALTAATTADAVAEALATFYVSARAAITAALGASAEAAFATEVLLLTGGTDPLA